MRGYRWRRHADHFANRAPRPRLNGNFIKARLIRAESAVPDDVGRQKVFRRSASPAFWLPPGNQAAPRPRAFPLWNREDRVPNRKVAAPTRGVAAPNRKAAAPSCGIGPLRQGVMKLEPDGNYLVNVDAVFSSPSATASIVAGSPSLGPQSWVDQKGVSLKSLLEKEKLTLPSGE